MLRDYGRAPGGAGQERSGRLGFGTARDGSCIHFGGPGPETRQGLVALNGLRRSDGIRKSRPNVTRTAVFHTDHTGVGWGEPVITGVGQRESGHAPEESEGARAS